MNINNSWKDASIERPKMIGKVFAIINGCKNIIHTGEFDKYLEKADTFYWLDIPTEDEKVLQGIGVNKVHRFKRGNTYSPVNVNKGTRPPIFRGW